MHKLST